jgi:hypothetical protein
VEYLVSIEDSPHHHWQADLLIESFRLLGLEKSLLVAMADRVGPELGRRFGKNLVDHGRVFRHMNYGRTRNMPGLNKPFAAHLAVAERLITQPFCLIDPDMVLVEPVPEPVEHLTFQVRPTFTREYAEANGVGAADHVSAVLKARKWPDQPLWLPLGSVMTFRDVPGDLFIRAISWAERLEYERLCRCLREGREGVPWRHTPRCGWVMALIEYSGVLGVRAADGYETHLVEHGKKACFVHYTHGLPPHWSKHMYRYDSGVDFSMGGSDPFAALFEHNPTSATEHLRRVARSYLARPERPSPP